MTYTHEMAQEDGQRVYCDGCGMNPAECMCCEQCKGTGKELCNNPDHGFINALSFHDIGRIGCPVCGHDEKYRTKYDCPECKGTGKKYECETCQDTGEVDTMEQVYPNEPHCEYCDDTGEVSEDEVDESGNVARGTLTRKCICRIPEDDGNDYDQDR